MDEMDLVSQLKEAAPLRPEAYDRARTTLRAAMAQPGSARGLEMIPVHGLSRAGSRRIMGTRGMAGIGAGVAAVAAAVAVGLVVTSTPQPSAPQPAVRQSTVSQSTAPAGASSQPPVTGSLLVALAATITAVSSPLPGNASLIIRTQAIGTRQPDVTYSLYTDSGALYSGDDKATLMQAVARHENLADGMDAGDLKAAFYAATGNLTIARQQMATVSPADGWLFLPPAAQKAAWEKAMAQSWPILKAKGMKTPPKMPTGQALLDIINNRIWNNSVEALSAGGGNPQVRAGVLRLLSTIPQVTVAHSTTGGLPTLTLTAGPALFGGSKQVLTINASTGMPITSVVPAWGGASTSVDTFRVTRVTLAAIAAGTF